MPRKRQPQPPVRFLIDCPHVEGFRCHVADKGGHLAICNRCGVWCFIDADGKVAEYPRKDASDSFHTQTDSRDDAAARSQNERSV